MKKIPIISIIGCHNSGKTTLIEKLIPHFNKKKISVGTIKYAHQKTIEVDVKGKDTYRQRIAGAEEVVLCSDNSLMYVRKLNERLSPDTIQNQYFSDNIDLILAEGYKENLELPKILVIRTGYDDINYSKLTNIICTYGDIKIREHLHFEFDKTEEIAEHILQTVKL